MARLSGSVLGRGLNAVKSLFETEIRTPTEQFIRQRIRQRHILTNSELDELVENVYQRIARAIPTYDPLCAQNPFSWLMTIVDHCTVDYLRAHRRTVKYPGRNRKKNNNDTTEYEPYDPDTPTPEESYQIKRAHKILIDALPKLLPDEREMLLIISLFPDMNYREIINITGHKTQSAAKQCKYRMAKKMRQILADMGYRWEMFGEAFKIKK